MSIYHSYHPAYAASSSLDRFVLGTAAVGGIWSPVKKEDSIELVLRALQAGVTHIDTAPAYNNAEDYVGAALRQWRKEMPLVSTKVGRLKADKADLNLYDYSRTAMRQSLANSLDVLAIPAVDILFLHEPQAVSAERLPEVLEIMQELKQKGWAKNLGIGGNYPHYYENFIRQGIFSVVMGYNRFNACCLDAYEDEIPFLQSCDVRYYQGSPLNNGLLGDRLDEFMELAPGWITRERIEVAGEIRRLSEQHGEELPSVAIQFLKASIHIDKVVMGPKTPRQLDSCIEYWKEKEMTRSFYNELITINLNKNNALHVRN